ncbi:hypothetical protein N2152v2_009658 [Parachlorella kessleri]
MSDQCMPKDNTYAIHLPSRAVGQGQVAANARYEEYVQRQKAADTAKRQASELAKTRYQHALQESKQARVQEQQCSDVVRIKRQQAVRQAEVLKARLAAEQWREQQKQQQRCLQQAQEAAAEASKPPSGLVSSHFDFRHTRLHETGPPRQTSPAAALPLEGGVPAAKQQFKISYGTKEYLQALQATRCKPHKR